MILQTFLWIEQELSFKKYYWYIVVITCNLYTDPNDLLFLLLAFWMIRASALQFARSLVRSTDGLKNQTGMQQLFQRKKYNFFFYFLKEIKYMSQFASVPSHFVWTLNFDNIYKLLYYILRRYNWIVKINFKHF